jgi:hypothetical protein
MVLAKTADILAQAGLRVLMIDFDLEAPGIEQYFAVDQKSIRSHAGLFDLVLAYKAAMAVAVSSAPAGQEFRKLQELFIAPVYLRLPSGGKLDLMPAGRRGSDEELSHYALRLRQFDWQDFFFNFGGEIFFEWLRRSLDGKLYDMVLVDSRTGVSEMGGICAYQLADMIVAMCAPNQQNLEGTRDAVRNFLSPRVMTLRGGRPLQMLVVPSRVETRDESLLQDFRERFDKVFMLPEPLGRAGLSFWDFMIPYDPRSAFQEHVVGQDSRSTARSAIGPAVQKLVDAIALLADPNEPVRRLRAQGSTANVADAQYDITSRSAGYDVFLAYSRTDAEGVGELAETLSRSGVRAYLDVQELRPSMDFFEVERRAIVQSNACAVIVGPSGDYPWRSEYLRRAMEDKDRSNPLRFVPILLPGAKLPPANEVPPFLVGLQWLRLQDLKDDSEVCQIVDAIRTDTDRRRATSQRVTGSPYKGFAPFSEADAAIFFGREQLVARIVRNLNDTRFLAVIGPSGSGKTSLVQAGIIPALRRGALPGSERWNYLVIRPGGEPVRALCDAFATVLAVSPTNVIFELDQTRLLRELLESTDKQFFLVIDQFEEAFTICENSERTRLFSLLEDIATNWKQKIALIIVLRSDQLSPLLELAPSWANLVESNMAIVPPMSAGELRKAIEAPLNGAGLAIEPGLTDLILRDAADAPGALPLVQYVLYAMWERRQQGYLTVQAYEELGGATGSLQLRAEECFAQFDLRDRDVAFTIMLRLVRVTPEGEFVRRAATLGELTSAGASDDVGRIVDALVRARLLVVTQQGSDVRVDLAHEAIIRAWPRFREQIENFKDFLNLRSRLDIAAARWREHGRDPGFLYPPGEIFVLENQGQLERHRNELSDTELEFIGASKRQAERRRRRGRRIILGSTVAFLAMTLLAIFAFFQRYQARESKLLAEQQSQFAALANLGAASAISPDGKRLLQIDPGGYLRIIDLVTGKDVARIAARHNGTITAAAFSPDGSQIAIGSADNSIRIYHGSPTPLEVGQLRGHTDAVRRLVYSPDMRRVASGSDDHTARVWSAADGHFIFDVRADGPVVGVAFSPDGSRLVISSQQGTLYLVDTRSGQILH